MAQVTHAVAQGILDGQGYTDNEARQLAHFWLAASPTAQAAPAPTHEQIAAYLEATGSYVTNDATREAAIAEAIDVDRAKRGQAPAQPDQDGETFRTAARLGLTLRFYGGCAQSGMPGTPSAYEVVPGQDRAAAMREAVGLAAAVIASGGESQRLNATPTPQAADTGAAQGAGITAVSGVAQEVYGPFDCDFVGAGVWAAIVDELPPSLVGKKVYIAAAPQPAPPADSVLEDAARYRWLADYLVGDLTDLDDEIVACKSVYDLSKVVDAARKQGGPHD